MDQQYSTAHILSLIVFLVKMIFVLGAPLSSPTSDCSSSEDQMAKSVRSPLIHIKNLSEDQLKSLSTFSLLSEDTEYDILPERKVECSTKTTRGMKTVHSAFRHMDGSNRHVERDLFHFKRPNSGVPSPFGSCSAKWTCFEDPTRYPAQRVQANMTTSDETHRVTAKVWRMERKWFLTSAKPTIFSFRFFLRAPSVQDRKERRRNGGLQWRRLEWGFHVQHRL